MSTSLLSAFSAVIVIAAVVYSIILHEMGHAFAAYLSGDRTAKDMGRISLNPIPHIDLVGSIILPVVGYILGYIMGQGGFIFGWAKPVPINSNNFRNRRAGEIFVSLAGVFMNFLVMVLCFFIFSRTGYEPLIKIAVLNFGLLYLTLLPLPPLDGYHFVTAILPDSVTRRIQYWVNGREMVFLLILFMLFQSPVGPFLFIPANVLLQFFAHLFQGIFGGYLLN